MYFMDPAHRYRELLLRSMYTIVGESRKAQDGTSHIMQRGSCFLRTLLTTGKRTVPSLTLLTFFFLFSLNDLGKLTWEID